MVVTGSLTLGGKTRTLETTLDVSLDDGFVATGRLKIKATDFGFEPYTAMLGALENRNQMTIRIELRS